MKLLELMLPQHMQSFLQEILGTTIRVSHVKVAKRLDDYLVLLVSFPGTDQRLVVKAAGRDAPLASQFDRTAALHPLVYARTHIRMAEIFAADTSLKAYPWRYLVKTYLPGVSFAQARQTMSQTEIANAFSQIGSAVGELHAIHFPAYGELDGNLKLVPGLKLLEALQERARMIIKSIAHRELYLEILEKRRAWFNGEGHSSLVHEDLHAYNLLFQRDTDVWQLATILDFDKAWAGPAESDLARLEFWRGMMHPQFWQAYLTISQVDEGYSERRALYQLLWCLEYAEATEQHLQDTQAVCRLLGIPEISY